MKRTTSISIAAAILAVAAAPVRSADPGFYLAASLGKGEEEPGSIGINISAGFPPAGTVHLEPDRIEVDDGGTAWGVALGYRFNRHFAAELEYLSFGTTHVVEQYRLASAPFPFPAEIDHRYSSEITGPALSLLGSLPLGRRFDAYLRAGVLFADRRLVIEQFDTGEATFGSTVWLGGVGMAWSATDRWAVRVEYQQTGPLDESLLAGETELERIGLSVLFTL
jgi:opacity protein-like surface antigen